MDFWIIIGIALIPVAAIFSIMDQRWPKKIFVILNISSLTISLVIQIYTYSQNKAEEEKKEVKANKKISTLSNKYDSATKIIIKQGDTIRLKEDGIKSFIETYLLKDSIMRANYDSCNKIEREKDHPELIILNPKLYWDKEKYFTGYIIRNLGVRTAINISLKEYIVTSVWDIYEDVGNVTLSTSGNLPKDVNITLKSLSRIVLDHKNFNYPTYYYIEGTYVDGDFKKSYPFHQLFSTVIDGYQLDSSALTICRPWEETKIREYIHRYE